MENHSSSLTTNYELYHNISNEEHHDKNHDKNLDRKHEKNVHVEHEYRDPCNVFAMDKCKGKKNDVCFWNDLKLPKPVCESLCSKLTDESGCVSQDKSQHCHWNKISNVCEFKRN